jgi:hypothetical protein
VYWSKVDSDKILFFPKHNSLTFFHLVCCNGFLGPRKKKEKKNQSKIYKKIAVKRGCQSTQKMVKKKLVEDV